MCWLSGEQEPDIHMPELRASDMQPKKKKRIYIGIGIKMGVVVRNGRSTSLFGHPDWAIDFAPVPCCFFFSILISQIKFAYKQNTAVNENRFSAADFPH